MIFLKYLILVYDGMADYPIPTLGNRTPMEVAKKPFLDHLASKALVGTVSNVPEGMVPESDTANLAILSYDPKIYSKGRSPLEAMSMRLQMTPTQTAFRCNLVTLSEDEPFEAKTMIDHSSDEISTEEARALIESLDAALGNDQMHFYTGVSYRHCLLWEGMEDTYRFMRPHDILGQNIAPHLPSGTDGAPYMDLMLKAYPILRDHPVNLARKANGKRPANSIWLWSPGKKPALPDFKEKWGLDATVISAVDLIKGIGICANMESVDVEGATGNVHTNYDGKAAAAIDAFARGKELVFVHVEGPDECGHRAEIENKILSIELIDQKILKPVCEYLESKNEPFRIMVLPDHPTPIERRTHTMDPVPFMIYDSERTENGVDCFTEKTAADRSYYLPNGTALMSLLTKK